MVINPITVEKLLSLPNDILEATQNEFVSLLSDETINRFYYLEMKKDLMSYMKHFNDMKYFYKSSNEYTLKSTSYTNEGKTKTKPNRSLVEEFVSKNVDNDLWTEEVYNHLITLAHKLNPSEQKYLVETFFKNTSEENISEKLGICRKTLQHIKKSCLVKMYLELDIK